MFGQNPSEPLTRAQNLTDVGIAGTYSRAESALIEAPHTRGQRANDHSDVATQPVSPGGALPSARPSARHQREATMPEAPEFRHQGGPGAAGANRSSLLVIIALGFGGILTVAWTGVLIWTAGYVVGIWLA